MDIKTFEKVKMQLAEEYFRNKSLRNNSIDRITDRALWVYGHGIE